MREMKKPIIVVLSLCVVITFSFIPGIFGLSDKMVSAIGLFIGCMALWLTESLPISISTLLMVCLLPVTGLMSFDKAIGSFGINTSLFIMASSGITAAISLSSIPGYTSSLILKRFQNHPKLLVFAVGIVTSLFSAFMSSLAACVLFEGILSPLFDDSKENSRIKKALMMAIPACAGIGGFMSPAGTPANILILDVLKGQGVDVSFLSWCAIGFPVGLITVLLFLSSLALFISPKTAKASITAHSGLNNKDKIIIVLVSIIIIGWFMSSFIKELNITNVAIVGLAVMFFPKIEILNLKTFSEKVNWDLVITIGSVSILMTAISDSGLFTMLVKNIFSGFNGEQTFLVLVIISACICIIRAFIPTTSAVVALFAPALISISTLVGIDIKLLMFMLAFWAASALLLIYTEPIFLITYKNKCYKEWDLFKSGALPSLIMIFLLPILISIFI